MAKSNISNMKRAEPPIHDADRLLAERIDQALWFDDELQKTNYDDIDIQCRAGVVCLTGHVGTALNKLQADNAVQRVPNVAQLENELVVDDELMQQVARLLGDDSRMNGEQMVVRARRGFVYLSGTASSVGMRTLAAEITSAMPQVRGIVNRIEVAGMVTELATDTEENRILQPSIEQEIFATDGTIGRLQKVIINPHNRRVSALLMRSDFPFASDKNALGQNGANALQMRLVVIPVAAIRQALNSGIFLTCSSSEATHFADLNAELYLSPSADWQPPYPYHRLDVLLN